MSSAPLRVGVLGAGWWAVSNHLPILAARKDVRITAVCRKGAAELETVRARFDIPFATQDEQAFLDHDTLDAVFVCTPHTLHARQAIAALERGLHVLVEKPVATTIADARALARATQQTSRHVMVPFGWNFMRFAETASQWVADGELGDIHHIAAQMASPMGDILGGADYAGTEDDLFRPEPTMWSDPISGGYGWGQLVHLLALLFHIAPLQPTAVYGLTDRTAVRCDLYNAAAVETQSGATISLSGSGTLSAGSRFQLDIRIFGSKGCLFLDIERERLVLLRADGTEETLALNDGDGAYACQLPVHHFIDLCLGKTTTNPAAMPLALRGCEVVAAMHASATEKRLITIEELT